MKQTILFLMLTCASALWADVLTDSVASSSGSNDIVENEVDEVIVTGARYTTTTHAVPLTVSVVGQQTLKESQQLNVLPVLMEQVPGLMLTERGVMGYGVSGGAAGGISMRGLSSGAGQVLVLIDGQPQYQGIFGHSIADSYQTLMAERVEVVRGPASMLYGSNAIGGVINIITRQQQKDGLHAHVHLGAGLYNTFQSVGSINMRYGGFTGSVAAQYSRSDNHREHMGFQQYGGMLKLGYRFSDHWALTGQADVTHFDASQPGSLSKPLLEADQSITRGVASLAVENHYSQVAGRISVYDNFGFHTINDGYAPDATPQTELFRSQDHLIGVSAYQTMSLFSGSQITLGLDYQYIFGHAWYTSRETGEVVTTGMRGMQSTNSQVHDVASYLHVHQDFTDWIALDAGIRYDHHSVAGGEWIPSAALVTHPVPHSELKASASRGFRNPTIKDMYLYKVANHDSLRAESVWHYELSWHQRVRSLSYGANIYYMHGDNLIQVVAGRNMNAGRVQNLGVEADLEWTITPNWSLLTNHSYIHMWYPVIGTPQYKGYLGASMHYDKWTASLGLQQLVGICTDAAADVKGNNATLVSVSVSYQPWRQFGIWIRGNNLLAQEYELVAGYPMPRATFMAGINLSF